LNVTSILFEYHLIAFVFGTLGGKDKAIGTDGNTQTIRAPSPTEMGSLCVLPLVTTVGLNTPTLNFYLGHLS